MSESVVLKEKRDVLTPALAVVWVLAYFGARGVLEQTDLATGVRVAAALIPIPFFAAFLIRMINGIRLLDELERKIHLEALAVAFPARDRVADDACVAAAGRHAQVRGLELQPRLADHVPVLFRRARDRQTALRMKNRLKVLRAERDWTQADLAEVLGVSRQTVNSIESGRYDPSLSLAFKLARAFGKRIEEMFEEGSGNSARDS